MEIRIRATGEIISEHQVASRFPNTSWPLPDMIVAEMLEDYCDVVQEVAAPAAGQHQTVSRDGIEQVGGVWRQKWITTDWSAGEIAAKQAADAAALQSAVVAAVQKRLDDFAKTKGYDGILSAATYVASTVPSFAAEGQYAVTARDAHWAACYAILADVQASLRPVPTVAEVLAEMPALEWPGS